MFENIYELTLFRQSAINT